MYDDDMNEFELDCEIFLNLYDGMGYDEARKKALETFKELKEEREWNNHTS